MVVLEDPRSGRAAGLADPGRLWEHLAGTLIPTASSFAETARIVILVHMAAAQDRIDISAIARTMTELGWSHEGGPAVGRDDIYPIWNDLWAALGNVGEVAGRARSLDRRLSPEAVSLIRDALFTEVLPY